MRSTPTCRRHLILLCFGFRAYADTRRGVGVPGREAQALAGEAGGEPATGVAVAGGRGLAEITRDKPASSRVLFPRKTPMTQKERERDFLSRFGLLYSDFPPGEIIECEAPDFLIPTDTETIGIEVVEYIRGQKPDKGNGGSELRKDENIRNKVARLARAKFEARDSAPLLVQFYWYPHRHFKQADVERLASFAAALIFNSGLQEALRSTWIRQDQLADTPLEQFVASIFVMRVRTQQQSQWSNAEFGFPEISIDELQNLVLSKEKKIASYLGKCDSVWLLIVADGQHISSIAELSNAVRQYPFQSHFQRVFFFNLVDQSVITLVNKD